VNVLLPNLKSNAVNVLNQLQAYPWIDQQTGVIQIIVYSYVPSAALFGQYIVELERTRAGMWLSSNQLSTFVIPNTGIIVTFGLYLLSMLIYQFNYFRKFVRDIRTGSIITTFVKYFLTLGWELVNTLFLFVHAIIMVLMCVYFAKVYTFVNNLNLQTISDTTYTEMDTIFSLSVVMFIIIACGIGVIVLKSMHYFEVNSYTSITFNTILMAFPHLLALLIVLTTIWFAFAVTATLLFAPKSLLFRQILVSFLTSWDMLSGNVGITSFSLLVPIIGPIYYIAFTVCLPFVLLNMFIGLISEFYNENMKQREYNVSVATKSLPFIERVKRSLKKYENFLRQESPEISATEAVELLAFKTFTKFSYDQFISELTELGVPTQMDDEYQHFYTTYLEKRRMRDLSGLETGDILTLWNLVESKLDHLFSLQKKKDSLKDSQLRRRKKIED